MSTDQQEDELFARLRDAEAARRKRAMAIGVVVALLCVAGFVLAFLFRDTMFRPELDVQEGEKELISLTNDPQCRGFIADITAIGNDYTDLEPKLDALIAEDTAVIDGLVGELQGLRDRVAAARETATQANLRFDNSRREVNDWFRYVDNELDLLQRVGRDRLAELAVDQPDAGTIVEDGRPKTSDKPMPERLSGATLATNEAFQKFRVWHTGGLHPCGAADEGETPWAPEETAARAK